MWGGLIMTVRFLVNGSGILPTQKHAWDPVESDLTVVTAGTRLGEWQDQVLENGNEWADVLLSFNPDSFENQQISVCETGWGPSIADTR